MALKKKTTKQIDDEIDLEHAQEDAAEEVEKTPAQLQRENDGADHGVRMLSAEEVHAKHGRDVVRANEAKARELRKRS